MKQKETLFRKHNFLKNISYAVRPVDFWVTVCSERLQRMNRLHCTSIPSAARHHVSYYQTNHQNGTCDYFLSIKNTEHAKNCLKVIILHAFNVFYTSISEQDPINIMAGRNNSPPDDQQRRSTRKRIKPEKLVMEVGV